MAAKKEAPKKAPDKTTKFNGDWAAIPSAKMLLALCIKSIETGIPMGLPTTREAALTALGYGATKAKAA